MAAEIAPGIWMLETDYPEVCKFPLWLYLVEGGDGTYALLDTGVSTTLDRILRSELATCGIAPADLTLIVNSHGHPDHMGGNASLRRECDAVIAAPVGEVPWIEDHERHWRELWDAFPGALAFDADTRTSVLRDLCGESTRVDRVLRDGDVVELGVRRLRVIRTGGHSPDHVALLDSESGCLFVFDEVQGEGTEWLDGSGLLAPLYSDPTEYVAGLERVRYTEFSLLCRSHGQPLEPEAAARLLDASVAWVSRVDALVADLMVTASVIRTAEVAAAIGADLGPYGGVTLQTVSVATGHLRAYAARGVLSAAWERV